MFNNANRVIFLSFLIYISGRDFYFQSVCNYNWLFSITYLDTTLRLLITQCIMVLLYILWQKAWLYMLYVCVNDCECTLLVKYVWQCLYQRPDINSSMYSLSVMNSKAMRNPYMTLYDTEPMCYCCC